MKDVLLNKTIKLNTRRKNRKAWDRIVRTMAMVVVFCTTYALILPAITMQAEPVCGIQEHTHSQSCYASPLQCSLPEDARILHQHGEGCTDEQGTLICTLAEVTEHSHDESCYTTSDQLVCPVTHVHSEECTLKETQLTCTLEEAEGHAHSESCALTQQVLICALEEQEPHTHGEGCYELQPQTCELPEDETHTHSEECTAPVSVLTCTLQETEGHAHSETCYETQVLPCELPETEGHTHSESCYTEIITPCTEPDAQSHVHEESCTQSVTELTCGKEELQLHTHEAACYDEAGVLTCTQPQVVVHTHSEACRAPEAQILICTLPEHTHEDSCYPQEEEAPAPLEFLCGYALHSHLEDCYNAEGTLTCTIPEHRHEAACVLVDLDLTADVETAEQWEAAIAELELTGAWRDDVLTVAQSQLDYEESKKNVILEGETLKGYTRYGAKYEAPYGDWNTMFLAFVLEYAGVEEFPVHLDLDVWTTSLITDQRYHKPDAYTPVPGDLVFFDDDQKADAIEEIPIDPDRAALVAEVIPATEEEPEQIRVIAGDVQGKVAYETYETADITIIGYGELPEGKTVRTLTYQGEDFAVTVSFTKDAAIPHDAVLSVREILSGTEEYETYYQQSMAAVMDSQSNIETLEISFARFFDITFLSGEEVVEPAAPVDIQITYTDAIEKAAQEDTQVVHFADSGTEVLNAEVFRSAEAEAEKTGLLEGLAELFTEPAEKVDTFRFTQSSFSVSGTIVTYATRAAGNTAQTIAVNQIDGSGGTEYVLYTYYNGRYYAMAAPTSGGGGTMVQVTVNNGTVTWNSNADIFWNFESLGDNQYNVTNTNGRFLHVWYNAANNYGTISSTYQGVRLIPNNNGTTFAIKHPTNNAYAYILNNSFQGINNVNSAIQFYIAEVPASVYHVWFDGTNGSMMSYYGSPDTYQAVDPANNTITLPETWSSPTKYDYVLNGWYDIKTNTWYEPGAEVTIDQHTVFYADWNAATYDVGVRNEHTVESLDTSEFVTTHVFDYNVLFNVLSQRQTSGTVNANGHRETWSMVTSGQVPYQNRNTLDFSFVDYDQDHTGQFSYAEGRTEKNYSRDVITKGIIAETDDLSGDSLLDLLFNEDREVIGKHYVGTGNYLFQYMDSTTPNYDGEHDGYYYLDARYNAASYNQYEQRFYLYDYLERTSDSAKDGGPGAYSDFLPFNSPYIFDEDQKIDNYVDSILRPGYEYDAKDNYRANNVQYSAYGDAGTNYFFGIRTDIEFFLPNDSGDQDEYGNYGNISTRGEHMVFEFHGDDDLWVYVDGELLLDVGGMHGVMVGEIDFSNGTVRSGKEGGTIETKTFEQILGRQIGEGTHNMTVYYMERGSSQSNCSIYFNIAPRYDLEIRKEDIYTAEVLNGTEFSIYTDEGCQIAAQLWPSQEAHLEDMEDNVADNDTNTFVVVDGVASCWGVSAGKTYYIKETKVPDGYPTNDDILRITLNNRGTATIETTSLHGTDNKETEGYAVIKQEVNDTLKIVALTVTNQKDEDTTEMRVKKLWDPNATDLPNSITAYLTLDGQRVGRPAVLTEANGWTYTWTGLPKYEADGVTPLEYKVEEVQVPGFSSEVKYYVHDEAYVEWTQAEAMADSSIYLLMNNEKALAYNPTSGFYWMDETTAKNDETGKDGQWEVTTNQYGFRLTNDSGYVLTYRPNANTTQPGYFYGTADTDISLNQVIYYLEGRLVSHDHDLYFQLDMNGSAVTTDGLMFSLIRKDYVSGTVAELSNTLMDNEDQTFVEVNKVWDDDLDHSKDSVTLHLYANGKDTGVSVVLNKANDWKHTFEGLPYEDEEGNVIVYTIVEDEPEDYDAIYESETLSGKLIVTWVKQSTLNPGGTYRIVDGANALALNAAGELVVAVNDAADQNQWWIPTSYGGKIYLKHAVKNLYLAVSENTVYPVSNIYSASAVTLNDEVVSIGGKYLQMTKSTVSVSQYEYNATLFTVAQRTEGQGKPGTGITVTNIEEIGYVLPVTGGMGTSLFTFGGLLMMAVALMYICNNGRKQRKGGAYSR